MAEEVGKGIVPIEADTRGLGADIAKKVDSEKGVISKTFSGIGSAMGKAFKAAAVAGVAGVLAAGAFAKGSIDAASDLSESMSKIDVVFGDSAQSVKAWANTSATAFGQSKQSALEAAGTYGNLFQAFGIAQKPAQEMSQSLVELAADLASFNNTSVEEALQALQSGVSGETEPLKRYGVAINDVRLKEEALALGLIKSTKDALTPAAKAQASYSLIMKDTTLAQGDFARTSDGLANKQRILAAKFQDVKAAVGKVLLPAFLAVVSFIADKVLPTVENMWRGLVAAFSGDGITSDGIVGVAERVGVVLRAVVQWVQRNWPTIKDIFARVMRAVGDALIRAKDILVGTFDVIRNVVTWLADNEAVLYGIATVIGGVLVAGLVAWTSATYAQVTALWAQAAAFAAAHAPLIAIVAVIAALVAAVIYAYQNWGWFRDAVDSVARFMRDTLWPALQDVFGWLRDNVPPIIGAVVDALRATWSFISDKIIPIVREVVETHIAALKIAFEVIKTVITEVVIPALQGLWSFISDKVIPIVVSIATTIGEVAADVGTKVGEIVGFVLGIPGRIASTVAGLWFGLENGIAAARTWVRERVDEMVGFVTGIPDRLLDLVSKLGKFGKDLGLALVNGLIAIWNKADLTFPRIDVPGWVPGIGGKGFGGFDVFPDINYVAAAQGALITKPTFALMGETARARPEVVSPVPIMAQTFDASLDRALPKLVDAFEARGAVPMPSTIRLRVGDREFDAYVEDIAGSVDARRENQLVGALAAGVR